MIDFKKKMEEMEKQEQHASHDEVENLLINNKKSRWISTYTIAVIVVALVFAGKILISNQNAGNWFMNGIFTPLSHLTQIGDKKLNGEDSDRINILLLGIGGAGHDGAYLTDTIMLVSLKPSTKQVSLISIPRDLVTPVSNWEKINSIDAYAEAKNPGSGGAATAQAISTLLQIPIQYYVRADFQGFINIINELGGIQVNVENTLDDYSYPVLGQENNPNYYARFEHLHVDKGLQTMDGALALKFARSRHALGAEGSDFARARRQQLVLEAVKAKLLSAQTLLNPVTITKLIGEVNKNISTNLSAWEILRVWELFKDVDRSKIINKVFSDAPNGFLVAGRGQDGAYILTPRSGNFNDIRNFVQNIFNSTSTPVTTTAPLTISDHAKVLLLNGTWISGLAGKTSVFLEQAKFDITNIANAPTRDYKTTIVYDLSGGKMPNSLSVLKQITGATQFSAIPDWLKKYQSSAVQSASSTILSSSAAPASSASVAPAVTSPDFVVILGTDADKAQ